MKFAEGCICICILFYLCDDETCIKLLKTTYEIFFNKKWVERKDYFESKQKFILRTAAEWKDMWEDSR